MSGKYTIELFKTPGGKQIAYVLEDGQRVAVSKTEVTAEEAIRQLREQDTCQCGGMLFELFNGRKYCLNCEFDHERKTP